MQQLGKMLLTVIGAVVLSFILWQAQDFIASFAASEVTTVTRLRTMEPRGDERVLQAYQTARQMLRVQAVLTPDADPRSDTRDFDLAITGKTSGEVLDQRERLVQAMRMEFSREGPGELFDIGNAPFASAKPNQRVVLARLACRGLSMALLLAALGLLLVMWKRSGLPKAALLALLVPVVPVSMLLFGEAAVTLGLCVLALAPPVGLAALIIWITRRVQRAAGWQEGRARITQSKVRVERGRVFRGASQVFNKPDVAYEFRVGSKVVKGDRISLGVAPADNVDRVLKRYSVGTEAAVFYDPANPKDCVLEREPPVSLGWLWSGAVIVLLVYGLIIAVLAGGNFIHEFFMSLFPQTHHPLLMLVTGGLGLLSLSGAVWHWLFPRKAQPWLRTEGVIVSSAVESYLESTSGVNRIQTRYYQTVIEFQYKVDNHQYHNTTHQQNSMRYTVSGGQSGPEEQVARYPVGKIVDVFYNPEDPTQSSLNSARQVLPHGILSLIAAVILLAIAAYAATH